jgi:uncharacterized protein (TIGR02421 family)
MINIELIQTIRQSLQRGTSIRRNLGKSSKLVIDQKLPYICVYRFAEKPDPFMLLLIKTQGAYLIARNDLDIKQLLSILLEVSLQEFSYFMIIELWLNEVMEDSQTFRILHPEGKVPATVTLLEKGFNELGKYLPGIEGKAEPSKQRHPENMEPLFDKGALQTSGALLLGIEVPSIFYNRKTKLAYPLFFRKLRRKFAEIIQQAAFEFIRLQADNRFVHYLMLGKTRLDNLVRSADRRIADISESMQFLLSVTPVNSAGEWERFKTNHFDKLPRFRYRLISIDPELEKRKLFNIPIENIEHPTLAFLLRDKRTELEKQLLMLEERATKKFFHSSQSLYGDIDKKVKLAALSLLNDNTPNEQAEENQVNATDFALAAEKELEDYRKIFPHIPLRVQVKASVSGLVVSGPELSVGKDLNISTPRLAALLQHEVGTHMLTYCNGHMQPLHLMYAGLAGYEQLQEGIAVLSEYLVGGLNMNRLKLLAGRVIATDSLIAGADFIETFRMLHQDYGFKQKTAFNISMRVHRGGGYTKDAIYLKGLLEVLEHVKEGGDLEMLYAGKFALEHVPLIHELMHLGIVKKPFLPAYLSTEIAKEKIQEIKKGIQLKELVS